MHTLYFVLAICIQVAVAVAVLDNVNLDDQTHFSATMPDANGVIEIVVTAPLYNATDQRPFVMIGSYQDSNVGQPGLASCSNVPARAMKHILGQETAVIASNRSYLISKGFFANNASRCVSGFPGLDGPQFYDLHDMTADEDRFETTPLGPGMANRKIIACAAPELNAGRITYRFRYNLDSLEDDCGHRGVTRTRILGQLVNGHQFDFGIRYNFALAHIVLNRFNYTQTWKQHFVYIVQSSGASFHQSTCGPYSTEAVLWAEPSVIYSSDHSSAKLNFTIAVTYQGVALGHTAGPFLDMDAMGNIVATIDGVTGTTESIGCYGLTVMTVQPPLYRPRSFCKDAICTFFVTVQTAWITIEPDGSTFETCMDGETPGNQRYDIQLRPFVCNRQYMGPLAVSSSVALSSSECSMGCQARCNNDTDTFRIYIPKTVYPPLQPDIQVTSLDVLGIGLHASVWDSDPEREDTLLKTARCALVVRASGARDEQCADLPSDVPLVEFATDESDMAVFLFTQDVTWWDETTKPLLMVPESIVFSDDDHPRHELSINALGTIKFQKMLDLFRKIPRQMHNNQTLANGRSMLDAAHRHSGIDGFAMNAAEFFRFYLDVYPDAAPFVQGQSRTFAISVAHNVIHRNHTEGTQSSPPSSLSRRLLEFSTQEVKTETISALEFAFTFTGNDIDRICGGQASNNCKAVQSDNHAPIQSMRSQTPATITLLVIFMSFSFLLIVSIALGDLLPNPCRSSSPRRKHQGKIV